MYQHLHSTDGILLSLIINPVASHHLSLTPQHMKSGYLAPILWMLRCSALRSGIR